MAATFMQANAYHAGELQIQTLLNVSHEGNPTVPFLSGQATHFLPTCPVVVLGTLSPDGAPWVSLVGGEPGFAIPFSDTGLAIKANVGMGDPILENLQSWGYNEDEARKKGEGLVAGLGINLETRKRLKFFGKVGREMRRVDHSIQEEGKDATVGMLLTIDETLGNCPKYLNKVLHPHYVTPEPVIHPESLPLPDSAVELIVSSGIFFVSSRKEFESMDTNHRGGPEGFVRVISNDHTEGTSIIWPEYSGNRLYQTLGNFQITPVAGVTIPNFITGDILYLSGTVEILIGDDAAKYLPRSNLAVKMKVTAARFVQKGLGIRGELGEFSPYNPRVRYLPTERPSSNKSLTSSKQDLTARLINAKKLTPTLARFTFRVLTDKGLPSTDKSLYKAGQYIALSFADELSSGYRHMDDSDPTGLNDDYIRTFTISSAPTAGQFDITIRKVGVVTEFLFRQTSRRSLDVPILGISGDLTMSTDHESVFIAGGVGITPYLSNFPLLDKKKTRLLWTIRQDDIPLLENLMNVKSTNYMEGLASGTSLYVTGLTGGDRAAQIEALEKLVRAWGVESIQFRRMSKGDVDSRKEGKKRWYICANKVLTKLSTDWLDGEEVEYENFDY